MNTNGTGLIIDNIYIYICSTSLLIVNKKASHYNFTSTAEYTSNKDDIIKRELEEIIVISYVEEGELAKLKAEKPHKKRQIA
jgi:hypothetical protein